MFANYTSQFARRALLPVGAALGLSYFGQTKQTRFCGIIAYLGEAPKAFERVSEGLSILENRGYDSVGVGAITQDKLQVDKLASDKRQGDCMERLLEDPQIKQKYANLRMAIGHTRWATCGGLEDCNAHPHVDMMGTVAVIHNGTILNHRALSEELAEAGVEFNSETDSEVIAQLIGKELAKEGTSKIDAIDATLSRLQGAWALVIIFQDEPERIYCTQNGGHITVGIGKDEIYVASESRAFERYARQIVELEEGEIVELGRNEAGKYTILNKEVKVYSPPKKERLAKGGFETFFEKEVHEQKDAVYNALGKGGRISTSRYTSNLGGLFEAREAIEGSSSLYLFGCGSSFIACQYVAYYFRKFQCFEHVHVFEASGVDDHDLPRSNAMGIFVSQSGETKDLQRILKKFKDRGLLTFGIVNVVGSWIAKETDYGCYMNAGSEVSVPSTKSFLCSIVCQLLVVLGINEMRHKRDFIKARKNLCFSLLALSCHVGDMLEPEMKTRAKELSALLNKVGSLLIIAKGPALPIAHEAALKFKETTYIHAESLGAGDLKHGPLALLDPQAGSPILLFVMHDERFEEMCLALDEVKARNAYTIVVSDCIEKIDPEKVDFPIRVPFLEYLSPLLALIPLQLTFAELAKLRGIDADKPRNLAKCVTVL